MKRRVTEILNLQKDPFYSQEAKMRWVNWEKSKISFENNKKRFKSCQEPFMPKARRFRYEP